MRNISQNLFFAFIYNAAGVPIAAGILYAAFGMVLSAVIAAAAMELSSVSVIGNALRCTLPPSNEEGRPRLRPARRGWRGRPTFFKGPSSGRAVA
jgi:hypothetical protein